MESLNIYPQLQLGGDDNTKKMVTIGLGLLIVLFIALVFWYSVKSSNFTCPYDETFCGCRRSGFCGADPYLFLNDVPFDTRKMPPELTAKYDSFEVDNDANFDANTLATDAPATQEVVAPGLVATPAEVATAGSVMPSVSTLTDNTVNDSVLASSENPNIISQAMPPAMQMEMPPTQNCASMITYALPNNNASCSITSAYMLGGLPLNNVYTFSYSRLMDDNSKVWAIKDSMGFKVNLATALDKIKVGDVVCIGMMQPVAHVKKIVVHKNVPDQAFIGLDRNPYLSLEGITFRIIPQENIDMFKAKFRL